MVGSPLAEGTTSFSSLAGYLNILLTLAIILIIITGFNIQTGKITVDVPKNASVVIINAKGTPCSCEAVYAPVCAKSGRTYYNSCFAKCDATEVARIGACDASVVLSSLGPGGAQIIFKGAGGGAGGATQLPPREAGAAGAPGEAGAAAVPGAPGAPGGAGAAGGAGAPGEAGAGGAAGAPGEAGAAGAAGVPGAAPVPGAPGCYTVTTTVCEGGDPSQVCEQPTQPTPSPQCSGEGGSCGYVSVGISISTACCEGLTCNYLPPGSTIGVCRRPTPQNCKQQGEQCGSSGVTGDLGQCCANLICQTGVVPGLSNIGVCQPPAGTPPCTDSDHGRDYNVQGTTTVSTADGRVSDTATDICKTSTLLYEYYCSRSDSIVQDPYECKFGCSNGRCNPAPTCSSSGQTCSVIPGDTAYGGPCCTGLACNPVSPGALGGTCGTPAPAASWTCTDPDRGPNEAATKTNASVYLNGAYQARNSMGDECYNSTSVWEAKCYNSSQAFQVAIACQSGSICLNGACQPPHCSETDNGFDFPTRGTTTGALGPGYQSQPYTDYCDTGTGKLYEYGCQANGYVGTQQKICDNGCDLGACRPAPICTDSDNGRVYDVFGNTFGKLGPGLPDTLYEDKCSGSVLTEYFCTASNYVDSETTSCQYGCTNGQCNPQPPQPTCSDTDNGQTFNVQGTVTYTPGGGQPQSYTDKCFYQGSADMTEFYCSPNNVVANVTHYCSGPNYCQTGRCT